MIEALSIRANSIMFLARREKKARYLYTETILFALHLVLYVAFLAYFLGPLQGAAFFLAHQAVLLGILRGRPELARVEREAIASYLAEAEAEFKRLNMTGAPS